MNLALLSIKRPAFITSIVALMIALGVLALGRLGVDLFPDVSFPIVTVSVPYPGAGPSEIETQVSKVLEDEVGTLAGIKTVRSISKEGLGILIAEFTLETDVKYAEQQIRDRVSSARRKLPESIQEPIVRRIDPGDQPILMIAVQGEFPPAELFDLASETLRPALSQVPQVGTVEVFGGRKREIHVELDQPTLKRHELSASLVSARLASAGKNIPVGKLPQGEGETLYRTLGDFNSLEQIGGTVVSFFGNEVPIRIQQLGQVKDTLADEKTRVRVNGQNSLLLLLYRQQGSNTVAVTDAVKKKLTHLEAQLNSQGKRVKLEVVRDLSKPIRANILDVRESIIIGIVLTIVVVFFFLGSARSTFITGLALPNSLLGAFVLMYAAGFTINVMTLLALSLAVGLLIDDAIVVRENIFRHAELGLSPSKAALVGTQEVTLAVIATTLVVISVFGPIAFLQGVVGQFFRQFGLVVCFAILISMFDAFTMAPMLSAYMGTVSHGAKKPKNALSRALQALLNLFERSQTVLQNMYVRALKSTLKRPVVVLVGALIIFVLSLVSTVFIPKTFLPPQDQGEFAVSIDLGAGSSLDRTDAVAHQVEEILKKRPEISRTVTRIGNTDGESNVAEFFVELVNYKARKLNTSEVKDLIRADLKVLADANPQVKDIDAVGGGLRPFSLNIIGTDFEQVRDHSKKVFEFLKVHPGLKDADYGYKPGIPEFQVQTDERRAIQLGVSTTLIGAELRTLMEGQTPAVFREKGLEYDIRVRLRSDQRNLKERFTQTFVPNLNQTLIPLSAVAKPRELVGPASITRQDRGRYIQIGADIAPQGPGMAAVMADIEKEFAKKDGPLALPEGMSYRFVGQAENFAELASSMMLAVVLAIFFIYLVLASLYESFVTPLTIMLVLPLAACGAFFALALTRSSLDIFSMIGCIMLLGVATKNSILLVDYAQMKVLEGMDRKEAMLLAGKTRLRPILMTSLALIAGMLPIAIGLNEASRQRTSMGIAIIGGLISSTVLTLLVIPAAYSYVDRFRSWSNQLAKRWAGTSEHDAQWTQGTGAANMKTHGDSPSSGLPA
jgi:HAE1 family hydrophobic/amphiphilic exporter-1